MKFRNESFALYVLIAIGVLAASIGIKARFSVEQHNRRAEIVVDYMDALNLALAAREPLDTVLAALRQSGVTTLALWEDPLDDMRLNGAMTVRAANPSQTVLKFSRSFPGEEDRVVAALRNKTSVPFHVAGDTVLVQAPYGEISALGIGLEESQVQTAIKEGFLISPRLFNYAGVTPTQIRWMIDEVKAQCRGRANVVIFNGGDVLGNRGNIDATAQALRADGLLYGSLELGKQIGDQQLSEKAADITVRVHSIGGNEMPTMEESTAVARFALATRERNIRSCYVRLFLNGLSHQPDVLAANTGYIQDIVHALHDGGIRIGAAHPFSKDPRPKRLVLLLIGLGIGAGGVLLLRQFVPVTGAWFLPVLLVSLAVGAFLATRESAMTGRQIDALVAAMCFPTIGLIARRPRRDAPPARSALWALEHAFRTYASMAAVTAIGIALLVGVLADRLMMLKVYEFLGIRIAIITPFVLLLLHGGLGLDSVAPDASWAQRRAVISQRWARFTASPLLMGQVVFGLFALAILAVIVMRSGNDPGVGVTSGELSFRALLNRIFYVRPRTKEIFFGYPLLLLGLSLYYSGNRRWYLLFALAGAIAEADLLNTFCHIHTPLLISFIRALLGWILGLIGGCILFAIVRRFPGAVPARRDLGDSGRLPHGAEFRSAEPPLVAPPS